MTAITVEALASFGSGPIPDDPSRMNLLLLCGRPSPGSLERYGFEFLDGQQLRPGARGPIRMTFAPDRLPPLSGPLLVWAGRIVGHIWGLHAVYRSQLEAVRVWPRTEASTGPRARPPADLVHDTGPTETARRVLSQPAI